VASFHELFLWPSAEDSHHEAIDFVNYSVYFNTEADMGRGAQRPMGRGRRGISMPPIFAPGSSTSEYQRGRAYLSQLSEFSGGTVFDALKMEDLSVQICKS
jgi:hypothetical protein